MPTDLDYLAPATVDDAVALRAGSSASAYLLGGTDLLPQMRAGRRSPERLVDLKRIPELHEIREEANGDLSIGAAVPLADLETHPDVLARFPLLAECAKTRRRLAAAPAGDARREHLQRLPRGRHGRGAPRARRRRERRLGDGPAVDPAREVLPRSGPDGARPGRARDGRRAPGGVGGVAGAPTSAFRGARGWTSRRSASSSGSRTAIRRRAGAWRWPPWRRRRCASGRPRPSSRRRGRGRRPRGRRAGRRGLPADHRPARERGVPARHGRRPRPPRRRSSWAEGGRR